MVKYLIFLLFPLFLAAEPFKVATYNVENLFDSVYQGSEYKEYVPGHHNWNANTAQIKLNHTAEVICDLDADIIGLQEIENQNVLEQLQKRLEEVGCPYPYTAITHKAQATIQVALLSKFPVRKPNELIVKDDPKVRNILEVELEVHGKPLIVFVNHWKSKSNGGYESKRVAYASLLKKRLLSLHEDSDYLIIGDLNSDYDAFMTLDERIDDAHGYTAINHELSTLSNDHLLQKSQMPKAPIGSHFNPWQELSLSKRWSHQYFQSKNTLDHLLLPKSMFDGKGIDYIDNSFNVFKTSYLIGKKGRINRWQYRKGKHGAKGYSDHLPVFALFDTKPFKANNDAFQETPLMEKDIEFFYTLKDAQKEFVIKNAVVLMKRNQSAIIKQSPQGRGIYLYRCAGSLQQGHRYDLVVGDITEYQGLKEIRYIQKLKDKGRVDTRAFFTANDLVQNQVLSGITGIYHGKRFEFNGKSFPIHFKNKQDIPPLGSKLRLHYVHLGYYKQLQLVVYSKKDFSIVGR